MIAARTMTGFKAATFEAIDHEQLKAVLRKYNRLIED